MKKIKVAVIGVGNIAKEHINAYRKDERVELYALCDINKQRLEQMGEKYGVTRLYTDKAEMLADLPEIDAVSVCTWNSAHAECAIAALEAGCDVLCEKPMAVSAAEAERMLETAQRNKKLLMIGFVRRFGDDYAVLKDYRDNGFFGEIYYAKAMYLRRNGSPGGWFGDKSRAGGGPLIDLGVHMIDFTRYVLGNPKPVSVYGAAFHKLANRPGLKGADKEYRSSDSSEKVIFDVEDLACALIKYDNGAVVSIETSFSLNLKRNLGSIEFFGTEAGARLDPELELFTTLNDYMVNVQLSASTASSSAQSFNGQFENELRHYVDCLTEGAECRSPARDGVEIMRILDAIYQSAETGHEVVL